MPRMNWVRRNLFGRRKPRWTPSKQSGKMVCPRCLNGENDDIIRLRDRFYECRVCGHKFDADCQGGKMLTKEEMKAIEAGVDKRLKRSLHLIEHPRQGKKMTGRRKGKRFGNKGAK